VIARHALLHVAGVAALGVRAANADLAVPRGDRRSFRVFRGDPAIGTHVLTFTHSGDARDAAIAVELRVGLGPIALFRYNMRGTERWRAGQLAQLDTTTNDDGTQDFAHVTRHATRLWVEGSRTALPGAPQRLARGHWNAAEPDGPRINPQDGKLLHPDVARQGRGDVADVEGQPLAARRGAMSCPAMHMELWVDATPISVALRTPAYDGSVIRYERI
jgi:hypothetical protein